MEAVAPEHEVRVFDLSVPDIPAEPADGEVEHFPGSVIDFRGSGRRGPILARLDGRRITTAVRSLATDLQTRDGTSPGRPPAQVSLQDRRRTGTVDQRRA